MKSFRKIIALILVFVTMILFVIIPASATIGDAVDYELTNMWSYLSRWWSDESPDVGVTYWKNLLSAYLADPDDPTAEDLQDAYGTYVENMYVTYNTTNIYADGTSDIYITPLSIAKDQNDTICTISTFDEDLGSFETYLFSGTTTTFDVFKTFRVPITGLYAFTWPGFNQYVYIELLHVWILQDDEWYKTIRSTTYTSSSGTVYLYADTDYVFEIEAKHVASNYAKVGKLYPAGLFYLHGTDLYPLDDNDFNYTTRPTVINMPIGYYDDSETFNVVEDTTIINETNNTYYNPITDESTNITNWYYDYSDRSYNVTLEGGDTVTVTYGDENITINEGNTTYNIYYMIYDDDDGSGSTSDDSDVLDFLSWWKTEWASFRTWLATALHVEAESDHEHTYTSTVTREPTCTVPGLRTYTCTTCGDTYTELIDLLGHDWVVTGHVDAVLDEEGNVVEEAYDEVTCSRCGEVGRDYGDGVQEEDVFDALGDLIADGITWILDRLTELTESLTGITDAFNEFAEKVQGLGGDYPLFLAAVFTLFPEDLMNVLWFGVVAFIVLAVWRKWTQ